MKSSKKPARAIEVKEPIVEPGDTEPKGKNIFLKIVSSRIFIVAIIIVLFLIPVGYHFYQTKQQSSPSNLKTVNQVVTKVSTHIILPKNETPTLATVTNVDVLKSNPFFANAAYGDKVLVYPQAKMAILYRPSIDRIIKVRAP